MNTSRPAGAVLSPLEDDPLALSTDNVRQTYPLFEKVLHRHVEWRGVPQDLRIAHTWAQRNR